MLTGEQPDYDEMEGRSLVGKDLSLFGKTKEETTVEYDQYHR